MSTQTSQLVSNLQNIYNEKLLIKSAIGTNSDNFLEYHTLIQNAISEGGGSGEAVDPWHNSTEVDSMIIDEKTTADYVLTNLDKNFSVTMDGNKESVEAVEWDFYMDVPTGEIDQQTGSDIMKRKAFHVIVNGDPHDLFAEAQTIATSLKDHEDLYENIFPTLQNVTLTASEDTSNDGYDYLLEGDLYAWNLYDNCVQVQEIEEDGFYPNNGALGFNVNVPRPSGTSYITTNGSHDVTSYATAYVDVPTGKQIDNNLCAYLFAPDYNNLDINIYAPGPRYYTSFSFFDQEVDTTTNHDDVITAEVTYYESPEGEPDKLPNCSYVQNLNVNWFNDVNNMGEGWFKLSFNYTGSEPIYLMFHLLKASYQTGGTDKWNMPSGYRFNSWWENGVNFIDNDDSPSVFQILGAGYYYFYICAGTFDGTSGTYSRSFRPPFENTSQFITPREFFGE